MPRQIREHGFSTTGAAKGSQAWLSPLTDDDITRTTRSFLASMQAHAAVNAETYANARVERSQPAEPRYLISSFGLARPQNPFNRTFQLTYLPPRKGAYLVTPNGVKRPWNMVVLHQYGEEVELRLLRENKSLLTIAIDEFGHNPNRFASGVRELTQRDTTTSRQVSIHFLVSRRGDIVSSVDLNDRAYHAGGNIATPGFSLNAKSIGFELESHMARYTSGGPIVRQPFSAPQLQSIAIILRKIEAFRDIPKVYIQTLPELLAAKDTGGYVRHAVINTPARRIDAAAQFHIPPGMKALIGSTLWNTGSGAVDDGPLHTGTNADQVNMYPSGWDQLWDYMKQIRGYNLATEVFEKPPSGLDLQIAAASAAVSKASNRGQRIAVQSARDGLNAMRRSEQMQKQDRRTVYQNALATNQSFSIALAKDITAVNAVVDSHNLSTVVGVKGAVMFDESTGLWSDGEA